MKQPNANPTFTTYQIQTCDSVSKTDKGDNDEGKKRRIKIMPTTRIGHFVRIATIEESSPRFGEYGKIRPVVLSTAWLEAAVRADRDVSKDRQRDDDHRGRNPPTDFRDGTGPSDSRVLPALDSKSRIAL